MAQKQKVADAINNAQVGAIIDQSEEQVRDAYAELRQKTSRLFPPRDSHPALRWKNKGRQKTSHMTVNGRLEFCRSVFWNEDHDTVVPLDILLGIESSNHSLGVCEICCRESLNNAFVPASENIKRLAQ